MPFLAVRAVPVRTHSAVATVLVLVIAVSVVDDVPVGPLVEPAGAQ